MSIQYNKHRIVKCLLLFFIILISTITNGQITIIIDKVPANTPNLDQVYIAGTFNKWTPNATPLAKTADGRFRITLPAQRGKMEFKFTRGSWETVECAAKGRQIPNREIDGSVEQELHLEIVSWNDLFHTSKSSTANENVSIMTDSFYMPQFNRYRKIWLYLPSDYTESDERYPVLYMQDGQNIFDEKGAYSGEWQVDEILLKLEKGRGFKMIVVGIENGTNYRSEEYTPWKHKRFESGRGEDYMKFIVETLKPQIDKNYRTKPEKEHTGLMGSSFGGLISMYGILEYQDVFGKAGVFSPSFWVSKNAYKQVQQEGLQNEDIRIYLLVGKKEGGGMIKGLNKMEKTLEKNGFGSKQYFSVIHEDGEHKEWYWARELENALIWLYQL